MHGKSYLLLTAALFLILGCCKKTDDDTTYLYFQDSPEFTIPSFVHVGEKLTVTPKKLVDRAASDKETALPGCYWSVSPISLRDTVRREGDPASVSYSLTFDVPDSLQTLTVLCGMFAKGYNTTTTSVSCVAVRTKGGYSSLQGVTYPKTAFTDTRDYRVYHYTTVGGLDWMAENLAWPEAGFSYYDSPVLDDIFGRYYTWHEARTACPEGWRLPTNEEFLAFNNAFVSDPGTIARATFKHGAGAHMANGYFNGNRMWDYWPDVQPRNESGFSLLPLGYVAIQDASHSYRDVLNYALFWTADELDEDQAYFRSIFMKYDTIGCETGYKKYMAMNVRCVRTSPMR